MGLETKRWESLRSRLGAQALSTPIINFHFQFLGVGSGSGLAARGGGSIRTQLRGGAPLFVRERLSDSVFLLGIYLRFLKKSWVFQSEILGKSGNLRFFGAKHSNLQRIDRISRVLKKHCFQSLQTTK